MITLFLVFTSAPNASKMTRRRRLSLKTSMAKEKDNCIMRTNRKITSDRFSYVSNRDTLTTCLRQFF
jgi:hypothetical protein